jgi:hypothetical protein
LLSANVQPHPNQEGVDQFHNGKLYTHVHIKFTTLNAQYRKIGKPNNLKVFGSNGPKQDSQNRQRSSMPEGGEP